MTEISQNENSNIAPTPQSIGVKCEQAPAWLVKFSHCISTVFSPLLVPTYCVAIAMWVTPLAFLPERTRFLATMMIMFITAGLPFAAIVTLMRLGKVSDLAISNRRQRTLPLCLAILFYIVAVVYIAYLRAPIWLVLTVAGAAVSALAAMLISLKWKVSGHATGMGGMIGMLLWLAFNNLYIFSLMSWIVGAIVIAGLVGSARLVLRYHTPAQIYAGYALGLACIYLTMSLTYFFL